MISKSRGQYKFKKIQKKYKTLETYLYLCKRSCVQKLMWFRGGRKNHRIMEGPFGHLSQFLNKSDFLHHLQITQIFLYMVTYMWQRCIWKKVWKYIFYNAPLRYRPMFWSFSLEGSINSKKVKPWKPSFGYARDHVCKNWGDLEVVKKTTAFRRDHLVT